MRRILLLIVLLVGGIGALVTSGALDEVIDGLLVQFAGPARVEGPVLPITVDGAPQVVVLTRQVMTYSLGRRSTRSRAKTFFDLAAFDGRTAAVLWQRGLRTVTGDRAVNGLLLGRDGAVVWLYLDGIVGVATGDGQVVADAARLAEANPALAGQILPEARYYGFARGLVLTAADGRLWRIGPDLKAVAHDGPAPPSSAARALGLPEIPSVPVLAPSSIPPMGIALPPELEAIVARQQGAPPPADPGEVPAFHTPSSHGMFRAREMQVAGTWLALMDDPPSAGDVRQIGFARPPGHRYLGGLGDTATRQRLWHGRLRARSAAPPGWPADFPQTWGETLVIEGPRVLLPEQDFLGAGLFGDKDAPFVLAGADGRPAAVLLAHRSRLGEAGRVLLSRVDLAAGGGGRVAWTTDTTLSLVQSVMRGPGDAQARTLVLFGRQYRPDPNEPARDPYHNAAEILAAIDLETGTLGTHVFPLGDRPWR
ncbi:PA2928 family protein [Zavarzinia sp. CC-PAN008]|uniref:PA2928 family protein n=1 Tax=Zavarzinia sp. CC-PAN008 TaxID=3243332 RepID=UPI003F7494A6